MELIDFLLETQIAIRDEVEKDVGPGEVPVPPEVVFTERLMAHMADEGITFDPVVCHFEAKVSSHNLKISGYAVSDTTDESANPDRLDLFVSLYKNASELVSVPDAEIRTAAKEGVQFLRFCAAGRLAGKIDETNDVYSLVVDVERIFSGLDSIRIFVITDGVAKTRSYEPLDVAGKQVRLEIMDIQRLFNHVQQGRPRDELVVKLRNRYAELRCPAYGFLVQGMTSMTMP
ncbi:hypothetical protein ULG90_12170 [Halopseudomonas pachastrellae]|nr:hypothetical protein ULG90_12170 [Halopseudomonas pachastrellae]